MRSSIACARCRRSKVKCINNGVNTTCRACDATGRECTYPSPASATSGPAGGAGAASKRDSHSGPQTDSANPEATPKRPPRPRKAGLTSGGHQLLSKDSPKAIVDALDQNVLTPKVWTELFEIFQLHFSTELPFLHPPTFLKPLRQSNMQSSPVEGQDRPFSPFPPVSHALLLAFLALTSRFHPALVGLHSSSASSRPANPLAAAEYYAAAAKSKLSGNFGDALGTPTIERTQALLMLSLHEWGMCRGSKAWIMVGVAVRTAQILGMQFEEDLDDLPLARSTAISVEPLHLGLSSGQQAVEPVLRSNDAFIEEEIRRRTFWSCFVMDRFLSSGKYRPQMLHIGDIRVQLPSSERAFLFGEKVRTGLLGEDLDSVSGRTEVQNQRQASVMLATGQNHDAKGRQDEGLGRWEVGNDESPLSRYIKVLELYGKIVKWSCGGGRRRERFPPWDSRSTFFQLQKLLLISKESLPRDLTLSPANTSAHVTSRTSTPYTLLHSVICLSHIMLHREYIPFIPICCAKPQGPLDPPTFQTSEYQIPHGFWDSSARELFKASRDLIDLLGTCQEWGTLVETPIVGFAAYTAAHIGVYAINFPWMDPDGYMCNRIGHEARETGGVEAARKALEIVGQLRKRLHMADGWFKTIRRVHIYFGRIKKDFKRNSRSIEASALGVHDLHHLSLREGGTGGGLDEFKLIERTLKEFGSIEDEDLDMMDVDPEAAHLEESSDAGSAAVKCESIELQEGSPDSSSVRQDRWHAINSSNTLPPLANGHSKPGQPPYHSQSEQPHFSVGPGGPSITSPTRTLYMGNSAPTFDRGIYNPTPIGPGNPYSPQLQTASFALQHQVQPKPAETYSENWFNSLDTRFGADDLAAFVAGNSYNEFAGTGGWLSTVWGGGSANAL